jgi:hypothetical protein
MMSRHSESGAPSSGPLDERLPLTPIPLVMDTAVEHLKARQQDTWIEAYNSVHKSIGQAPVPKAAFSS